VCQGEKLGEDNFSPGPSWSGTARFRRVWTGEGWIDDAGMVVLQGRVVALEGYRQVRRVWGSACQAWDGIVVPGLVNAHTHLELAGLAGKVPLGDFAAWAAGVARQDFWDQSAVERAMAQMGLGSMAVVLDTATRAVRPMLELWSRFGVWEFGVLCESLTKRIPRAWIPRVAVAGGWVAPAAHSVYATAPEVIQGAKDWCRQQGRWFSLHVAEREGELAMAQTRFPCTQVAQARSVVDLLDRLGVLDAGTIVVHGVHLGEADVQRLAQRRSVVCLCPRSNEALGVGRAPWSILRRVGVGLCLGTDSLASAPDGDLWQELAWLKEHLAPELSLEEALALVTGQALGRGRLVCGEAAVWAALPGWCLEMFS
jgi:cytosine/adenosine deaminase-related metal-dependent hydrolase